jgi:hypothetical protein
MISPGETEGAKFSPLNPLQFLNKILLRFCLDTKKRSKKKPRRRPFHFFSALFLDEKCQKSRLRLLRSKNLRSKS